MEVTGVDIGDQSCLCLVMPFGNCVLLFTVCAVHIQQV